MGWPFSKADTHTLSLLCVLQIPEVLPLKKVDGLEGREIVRPFFAPCSIWSWFGQVFRLFTMQQYGLFVQE